MEKGLDEKTANDQAKVLVSNQREGDLATSRYNNLWSAEKNRISQTKEGLNKNDNELGSMATANLARNNYTAPTGWAPPSAAPVPAAAPAASPAPAAAPAAKPAEAAPPKNAAPAALTDEQKAAMVDKARGAIKSGKDPEAIKEILRKAGIDPSGL